MLHQCTRFLRRAALAVVGVAAAALVIVPSIAATPVPLCDGQNGRPAHVVGVWHPLNYVVNGSIVCTYGHHHGSDPSTVDSVFGNNTPGYSEPNNSTISYPWSTTNENSDSSTSLSHQPSGGSISNISYVQSAKANVANGTSVTVTLNNVNAGDALIVGVVTSTATGAVSSIADGGDTFTKVAGRTFLAGSGGTEVWAAYNASAGNKSVVVTGNASLSISAAVAEYAGIVTSSGLDVTSTATGTSTAPNSGSATTTNAYDLLVGVFSQGGNATFSPGSGYTLRQSVAFPMYFEDQLVRATGSYAATATLSASQPWTANLAAFKGTSTPATPAGGKHRFYKWEVLTTSDIQNAPKNTNHVSCFPDLNSPNGTFDNVRMEVHADANAGADVRFHSFYVDAEMCDPNDSSYHGQVHTGGHFDYGKLYVNTYPWTGTSTGSNTSTTLNDTSKNWPANQYGSNNISQQYNCCATLTITAGTGSGQTNTIIGNTATQLTLENAWTTIPDATSQYAISNTDVRIHLNGDTTKESPDTPYTASRRTHGDDSNGAGCRLDRCDYTWYGGQNSNLFPCPTNAIPNCVGVGSTDGIDDEDWGGVDTSVATLGSSWLVPFSNLLAGGPDVNDQDSGLKLDIYAVSLPNPSSLPQSMVTYSTDGNGAQVYSFSGYTDRHGYIVTGCTTPGVDCVPLDIINAKAGYFQISTQDILGMPPVQFDSPQDTIVYPN